MKILQMIMLGLFFAATPFVVTACEDENGIEEGAEEISDEVDDSM